MNSKERMKAAIMLQPVDKVPNAPFYEAPICNYFGKTFRGALIEDHAMAEAHIRGVEKYQLDWVMVGMGLIGGILPEALGCTVNYPGDVFPIIEKTSIQSEDDVESLVRYSLQTDRMERFVKGVSLLHDHFKGEVPIAVEFISPFSIATRLRGTNEIMDDLYQHPAMVHRLQELLTVVDIELGRVLLEAGVQYIFYGADMECPLLISPKHYEEFVHPYTSRVINALSGEGGVLLPHMCGNIVDTGIVDLLMETGCRAIMPGNLTQAEVLDIRKLKAKVKDRICIFDNLNPNTSLLIGTPAETAAETQAHLDRAKGMHGYIFTSAGTMAPTTPQTNFEAMNDTVVNYPWAR